MAKNIGWCGEPFKEEEVRLAVGHSQASPSAAVHWLIAQRSTNAGADADDRVGANVEKERHRLEEGAGRETHPSVHPRRANEANLSTLAEEKTHTRHHQTGSHEKNRRVGQTSEC